MTSVDPAGAPFEPASANGMAIASMLPMKVSTVMMPIVGVSMGSVM